MKKFLSGFLVLCLSLALLTACGTGGQTGKTVTAGGLTFAKSYSEVYSALTDAQKAIADRSKSLNMSDGTSGDPETGGNGDGEGTFYSGTNVQVAGVDEGDIVKTDGTYIYILRGSELIVMQADGTDVADVSNVFVGQDWEQTTTEDGRAHTQEKLPLELYLADGRAVVLSSYTDWTGGDASSDGIAGSGSNYVTVDIYDVSDPAAPTLVQSLGQDGYEIASRMVGGVLYLCTSYYPDAPEKGDEATFAPRLYDGETVYMTAENLYLCTSVYDDGAGKSYKDGSYTVTDYTSSVNTVVNRFAVTDGKLAFAANGAVAGALNNQFSLDERDGYLRMATTEQTYAYSIYRDEKHDFENTKTNDDATQTRNDVYVLDSDLNTVGRRGDGVLRAL